MPTAEAREPRRPGPRAVVPQRQIRDALTAGDLTLHYQPIVDARSGRIVALEALLRLRASTGHLLMPDDFLPAIAHTPVMHDVTAWVVDAACGAAAAHPDRGVAINVAAVDVVRESLVELVRIALRDHELAPTRLTIELTEHAALQGMDRAVEVMQSLRALGIELSLDDFGTGYSSLLYLRDLPLSQVKIDRAFTTGVSVSDDDRAIVRSVIDLAHRVGLSVVAEGVETAEQLEFLRAANCDLVQGHLFAAAAPIELVPDAIDPALLATTRPGEPLRRRRREPLAEATRARIGQLAAEGASLHTIAAGLNRDGITTPTGTRWTAATVARALAGY